MYSLRVADDGMREPHWHPVTAEMGYVQHGDARMTIMNPDGTLDTWKLTTGDMYFIRAYPHHIENIGADDWHFLIFFDQPFRLTSVIAHRPAPTRARSSRPHSTPTSTSCRPSHSRRPIR